MVMPSGSIVVSAIHHTDHFWFLLSGRILVNTNGEVIEHIAPCYEKSTKAAKRLITCLEDCVFINVHKNPSNTKNLKKIEEILISLKKDEKIKSVRVSLPEEQVYLFKLKLEKEGIL